MSENTTVTAELQDYGCPYDTHPVTGFVGRNPRKIVLDGPCHVAGGFVPALPKLRSRGASRLCRDAPNVWGFGAISGPPVSEDAVLLEPPIDGPPGDAERTRRRFLVVLEHGECLEDQLALDVRQGGHAFG